MTVEQGEVLRCTVDMEFEGFGANQNVYHLVNDWDAVTDVQAIDDVVEILEALMNVIQTIIAVLQFVNGVRIVNVSSLQDVGYGVFNDTTPFEGTGLIAPSQVALGVNLFTQRLGSVGRKYFGIPPSDVFDGGGIVQTANLVILALAGDLMTEQYAATNSSWRFGVIATLDAAFLPFQSFSLPTMAIIQRRRRKGVGI